MKPLLQYHWNMAYSMNIERHCLWFWVYTMYHQKLIVYAYMYAFEVVNILKTWEHVTHLFAYQPAHLDDSPSVQYQLITMTFIMQQTKYNLIYDVPIQHVLLDIVLHCIWFTHTRIHFTNFRGTKYIFSLIIQFQYIQLILLCVPLCATICLEVQHSTYR